MKKIFAIILSLSLTAFASFALGGCNGSKETLVVYTEAGFAPWEFTAPGSTDVIGVDIEIAKYIANKYNYKLKVIDCNFDSIVAGIAEDNALGIAGISYNATRAQAVEYSTFYYGDAFQAVVYLKDSAPEINEDGEFMTANFQGAKLVYQTGTTSSLFVTENQESWAIAGTKDFAQIMAALQDMKDAATKEYLIVDSQVAAQLVASDSTLAFASIEGAEAEQYGVVAKKGNTALIEKVNAALEELLKKGEDGMSQIDKWLEYYTSISPDEE